MNILKQITVLVFLVPMIISCNKDCDIQVYDPCIIPDSIVGEWKLTSAFISAGGPQYWTCVEDGGTYTFSKDGTFNFTASASCSNGTYSIDNDTLALDYECDIEEIENTEGLVTFSIRFDCASIVMTPTSGPICTEGCSYKYELQ